MIYISRVLIPAALKHCCKRRTSGVGQRVSAPAVISLDQAADLHRLHCPRQDSDRGVVDAGPGAEQDRALLCGEFRGDVARLCGPRLAIGV
jgi:hypothetical protein